MLPRATSPSAQGSSSLPAVLPGPRSLASFPLCLFQAAQSSRNPSEQLPPPSLCLSSDQVLRVLAKNEKQLSLLRDLEGLKPQKVRTPQGLGTSSLLPHSGLHLWLHVLLPPPQTCPLGVSAKDHSTVEKSNVAPLQKRLGTLTWKVGWPFLALPSVL